MKWDFLLEAGIILILANQLTNALKGQCKAHKIFSRIILRSNLEEDWTSHDDFLSCLVEADMKAKRRYFFPNHDGGKALPKSLRKIIDENVARYDLPELDELDNLNQPEKSLKFSQEMASYLYGSSKSFYLVTGSTGGILIAMYALRTIFQRKFRISHTPCRFLIARTAHKSVFDGLKLLDCESILLPVYVEPDFNVPFNIDDDLLHQTLSANKEKICGVVFTRPTYQGVYNGKAALASQIEICHLHGVPVLVDEAHGAHLRFVDGQDAVSCGADLVVQSSHKGLMALSQTGLLHIGKDLHRVVNLPVKEIERIIQDSFSSFTTTSPNSLLLASLHASIKYFAEGGGLQIRQDVEYITELKDRLDFNPFTRLLDRSPAISRDRLFVDPFKLNVQFRDPFSTKIVDGVMVDDYLCEEYGIFCELNFPTCLTFVLPQNSKAAVSFLFTQLSNLQAQRFLQGKNSFAEDVMSTGFQSISFKKAESQLLHSSKTTVYLDYEDAELKQKLLGKVSAETILIYPPGVPFIIRGEEVTEVHYNSLRRFQSMLKLNQLPTGCYLQGNSDESLLQLEIFSE